MKTVIFEGAGWSGSESGGDVGNCRIRGTFVNDKGQEIYLEMIGTKVHRYSLPSQARFTIAGHVSHLFYTYDKDSCHSTNLVRHESTAFEWRKDNILKFINERLDCSFEQLDVREDWCGFSVTGNQKDDFHKKNGRRETEIL